jgi:hypothetical protein
MKSFQEKYGGKMADKAPQEERRPYSMQYIKASDYPQYPACSLGEIAAFYIQRYDRLTENEKRAFKYLCERHGEEKVWYAYQLWAEENII